MWCNCLDGWSENSIVTSELKFESYKDLDTGRREKRVSGTKPYGENEFSVLANIRKSYTVGAGSWRGLRPNHSAAFRPGWGLRFFWVNAKSPKSPAQISDVIWSTIPIAHFGCSVVSNAGGGKKATAMKAGYTRGRKAWISMRWW